MHGRLLLIVLSSALAFGATHVTLAQDEAGDQARDELRQRDHVYGSHLMSEQERREYRERMRSAESVEERERIRREHHERMQQRAKERGVELPDEPPARGRGMGDGRGMGPGGMGRGMGRGMGGGGGGPRE